MKRFRKVTVGTFLGLRQETNMMRKMLLADPGERSRTEALGRREAVTLCQGLVESVVDKSLE